MILINCPDSHLTLSPKPPTVIESPWKHGIANTYISKSSYFLPQRQKHWFCLLPPLPFISPLCSCASLSSSPRVALLLFTSLARYHASAAPSPSHHPPLPSLYSLYVLFLSWLPRTFRIRERKRRKNLQLCSSIFTSTNQGRQYSHTLTRPRFILERIYSYYLYRLECTLCKNFQTVANPIHKYTLVKASFKYKYSRIYIWKYQYFSQSYWSTGNILQVTWWRTFKRSQTSHRKPNIKA